MTDHGDFRSAVRHQRVLPVLRAPGHDAAVARVDQLVSAGCLVVELTTTTPRWEQALERTVAAHADHHVLIGLGTVHDADQAKRALALGAAFLVSPFNVAGVPEVADAAGVPFVPGAWTPTELNDAAAPAGLVKLFPAHVGGPEYLRSVRTVLPAVDIVPTGGIRLDDVESYLAAGALAVGVGSGFPDDPVTLAELFAG